MELRSQARLRARMATRRQRSGASSRRRWVALTTSLLVGTALTPLTVLAPATLLAPADAAVQQGFNLNPSDLKFILRQIKISEQHAANFNSADPCRGLMGPGEFQIPTTAQGEELPVGPPDRRRHLQQPGPRTGEVRGGRPDLPAERRNRLPQRRPRACGLPRQRDHPWWQHLLRPHRQRRRQPAAAHQQPDRRPERGQRCRRGRRRPGRHPRRIGHPVHPERGDGRRTVRALQLVVHPLRPVLRPRPGSRQQGR